MYTFYENILSILLKLDKNIHTIYNNIMYEFLITRKEDYSMEITSIKIKKFETESKMKAIASVTFDDCFAVHDIKVIENEDKVFIAMPNKRLKDGTFKDVAHPINFEFRQFIEAKVIEAYNNAEIEE